MFVLDNWLAELAILLATAAFSYYMYFLLWKTKYWSRRNVPHLQPKFLGNALKMNITQAMQEFMDDLYQEHKEKRILGFWSLQMPALVVFDPEIIKNILTRDFSSFHDRFNLGEIADHDPLSSDMESLSTLWMCRFLILENLFNLTGHAWRNMRVKLTPTFTSGKMKMMYPIMQNCQQELMNFLKKSVDAGESVDCKDISARFTTNIIATCAFGIEANALENPNNEFRIYGKKIFEPTGLQIFLNIVSVIFPFIGRLFKIRQVPGEITNFFISTVRDTMAYRKQNNVKRNDFMQLLIELREKGKIEDVDKDEREENSIEPATVHDSKFTLDDASAQAFLFFAAGFETSSTTITIALYELAKNQDIQRRLREEIKAAEEKDGGEIKYDTLVRLEYLECVIQETLRKYPVVPCLFRETVKDYYIADLDATIPKKIIVFIPNWSLIRDPEFFPEPEKFDPDRFSAERKDEVPPFCHMPFGEGPRNCIGNRFGLLQTKVGLVSFLSRFSVHTTEKTPEKLKFGPKTLTLSIVDGLFLKLVPDE